jgi:uncharacterized protein YecT (DUF1311 family)
MSLKRENLLLCFEREAGKYYSWGMTKNLGYETLSSNRRLVSFRARNQVQLLALIAGFSLTATQSRATDENETVVASPDGTYELHQIVPDNDSDDIQIFVFSTETPKQKKLLDTQPAISGHTWHISPDSNWLADQVRDVHEVGHMELYHRIAGLNFDKVKDFSGRAWASLSSKRKYPKGEEGIIDFVNWSPDNARLLISLRGPVHGDADDKPWFTDWSVYFNLPTQKFEYTAYLDRWNSQVFKLAANADYDELTSLEPASAEPLADTVSKDDWEKRQTEADRALNEVYHKLLVKLSPADAARLRSDEVAWIKKRDKVSDEFAKQGTPPNPAFRRLQATVDLTNARSAELEAQLKESETQ